MISPLKRKARHPPFVLAFKAVIRNPKISPQARLLLLVIKSYADSSGLHCYPGNDTLAEAMGCAARTVKRLVSELRAVGMLSTAQRRNKDGKTSTLAYLLDDERRARLASPPKKKRKPGAIDGPPLVTPMAPGEASKVVPFTEEKREAG